MTDKIIPLAEHRAVQAEDCTKWTALDCAKAFVRDLESGDIAADSVIIDYVTRTADGARTIATYRSGLNADAEIALRTHRLHGLLHHGLRDD